MFYSLRTENSLVRCSLPWLAGFARSGGAIMLFENRQLAHHNSIERSTLSVYVFYLLYHTICVSILSITQHYLCEHFIIYTTLSAWLFNYLYNTICVSIFQIFNTIVWVLYELYHNICVSVLPNLPHYLRGNFINYATQLVQVIYEWCNATGVGILVTCIPDYLTSVLSGVLW